jgi:hypothetical protein
VQYFQTVRDRKLSLWQSAVADLAAQRAAAGPTAAAAAPGPGLQAVFEDARVAAATALVTAIDQGLSTLTPPPSHDVAAVATVAAPAAGAVATLWPCNKLALHLAWARAQGDALAVQKFSEALKFSNCDPGWAETVELYLRYFQLDKAAIPYRSGGDYVLPDLPDKATLALIGDWGTGTQAARRLLGQVARKAPDVVIHLGDIYYSGTTLEGHSRFLNICRDVLEPGMRVYTLSGNHDMYSGGAGYYGLLDELHQPASYFCLRNASWQFLALDTGYNDFNPLSVASNVPWLTDIEAQWHLDKIRQAGPRRTVLLSHHQLFSAYEPIGGAAVNQHLLDPFRDVLGQVTAWFWGHEHRLDIYGPNLGLSCGRCLGCSAIPVFVEHDHYDAKFDVPLVPDPADPGNPIRLGDDGTVYNHAYAILRLDGTTATVAYYQDSDETQPMYQETLP